MTGFQSVDRGANPFFRSNFAYFCYKYKGATYTAQNDTIIIQIQQYGEIYDIKSISVKTLKHTRHPNG